MQLEGVAVDANTTDCPATPVAGTVAVQVRVQGMFTAMLPLCVHDWLPEMTTNIHW
jgi:hypothetical protein